MLRIVSLRLLIFTILFASRLLLAAQTPVAAPVPVQILSAKKVFISNAGTDSMSMMVFKRAGDPDQPYNQFYAAVKSWGKYELVSTPADADLIFEIRFTAPNQQDDSISVPDPQLGLTIRDVKTHFILWTFVEPVQGAFRKATWDKNFREGMTNLMADLRHLTASTVATADSTPK